jgi:D-alanyl-D-alanine endopeptidase (penicillin-binding protein 7)
MRFQALFLSLVVLISILISGSSFSFREPVNENIQSTEVKEIKKDNDFIVFLNDFSDALVKKTHAANQQLAFMAKNFNQNLLAIKEILSWKFKDEDSNLNNDFNQFYFPVSVLTSEAKLNKVNFLSNTVCQLNQSDFSDFKSRVILIKYLMDNPSDSDETIFEFNADKRWPIASITKLMTAVVAMEKMDLDKKITLTEKAVNTEGVAGEFQVGEVFKLQDLIKTMLMASSNDAAMAIAESFGEPSNSTNLNLRGERDFIDEMQRKAAELKMISTTYLEPTGLSFINQSTANDLAKLMTYIYFKHPEILEISRQKEVEILELKSGRKRKILTVNRFAGEPDFIGGKTGYIDEAGRNLVSLFEINGRKVLSVVLGADDSFKETEKLKNLVKNCK